MPVPREVEIAGLLRQANHATTAAERTEFVRKAEELKNEAVEARLASSGWSAEDAKIVDNLVPAPVHELSRTSVIDTDWINDLDISFDPKAASHEMVAEASLWYGRVSDEVKSYGDEYQEQAKNLARHLAGKFGEGAEDAAQVFIDEANRLRATAVRSGIVTEAAGLDPAPQPSAQPDPHQSNEDDPDQGDAGGAGGMSTTSGISTQAGLDLYSSLLATEAASTLPEVTQQGYPTDVFSNLSQNGTVPPEATSSNRAPVFQELNDTSGDVVPVNDPGLGQTDDLTGANKNPNATEDHASKGTFPVSGTKKESSMEFVKCATCGGHGKLAVRSAKRVEAASGLPQIDQIVDAKDNASVTPYPFEVAFPWVMNPSQQIPAAIQQAEQQVADRGSLQQLTPRSHQSVESRRVQSGGRDNSGWIGDAGARGTDYPGEQFGQPIPPGNNLGQPNPVYQYGGDQPNRPNKPYGAAEEQDYTNNQGQNWQPGQPTQDDQGAAEATGGAWQTQAAWNQAVRENEALQSALAYVEQQRQAVLRSGR